MPSRNENGNSNNWTSREAYLMAMVALFVGLIAGFLLHGTSGPQAVTAAQPPSAAGAAEPVGNLQSPEQLNLMIQPLLDAAKANPKDPAPLVQIGNTYYDHQFYSEAIKFYLQALALKPDDRDVRTDMGTAMFYAGEPAKAVAEIEKVLKADPKHANALFNLGVIKRDGLHDNKGAVAAWERLLASNPAYPQKQKVQELIAKAKSQS